MDVLEVSQDFSLVCAANVPKFSVSQGLGCAARYST